MKVVLVGVALAAGTIVVQAADLVTPTMPVKAPVRVVEQVYNWTGFYAGVNVGGSVGRELTRAPASQTIVNVTLIQTNESYHQSPIGMVGGGQLGVNWQIASFVFGLEADFQGSGQRDRTSCMAGCNPAAFSISYDRKLDWFGTVRGRAGFASGSALRYITGGYAYGHVETTISTLNGGAPAVSSSDRVKSGYAIGSGVEASLGGNWTAKVEHLYLNLGTINQPFTLGLITGNSQIEIRDHIYRAGLNYRFGGNNPTQVATANWTGFYAGGNGGTMVARNVSSFSLGGSPTLETFTLVPEGFIGGGQIGLNVQAAALVFGLEADIQGSTAKDNKACLLQCIPGGNAVGIDQRQTWLATVRGRLGVSAGTTLVYGTGGYAHGETQTKFSEFIGGQTATTEVKRTRSGWTAGGGIETPLLLFGKNWSTKTEYLYVDLGRADYLITAGAIAAQPFSTTTREHIFRSGLNLHFNSLN